MNVILVSLRVNMLGMVPVDSFCLHVNRPCVLPTAFTRLLWTHVVHYWCDQHHNSTYQLFELLWVWKPALFPNCSCLSEVLIFQLWSLTALDWRRRSWPLVCPVSIRVAELDHNKQKVIWWRYCGSVSNSSAEGVSGATSDGCHCALWGMLSG